jgi:hypothetical protein
MAAPSENDAVKALEVLVGEWTVEATPPGGEPWQAEAWSKFEWMEGAPLLIATSHVEMPEFPDGICVIGADTRKGTYFELYTDDRDVQRIYEMSLEDGEWRLWRDGPDPFPQRFVGQFSEDGKRIEARWEGKKDGSSWETDFDLVYTKVK